MRKIFLGNVRIENVNGEFIRLTVDGQPYLSEGLDQMEAQGTTLAEALLSLHEQVEAVTG